MYPPFYINDLLGPLMALGMLKGAIFVSLVYVVYKAYLNEQDSELG